MKPKVTDISATGTPSSTTYLRGDGTWDTPAGGGGGGGADYISSAVGWIAPISTSQGATVGNVFTAQANVTIGALEFLVAAPSAGIVYRAIIAELNGSNNVVAVSIGSVGWTSPDTSLRAGRVAFSAPITLTAGKRYLIGINRSGGTNTNAAGLYAGNIGDRDFSMNGLTYAGYAELQQATPAVAGSVTLTGSAYRFSIRAIYGSGLSSGGLGGYFSGISGVIPAAASGSASATKAIVFRADTNFSIDYIDCLCQTASTANTLRAEVWSCSAVTVTNDNSAITAVTAGVQLGASAALTSDNASMIRRRFPLASPAAITAGNYFMLVLTWVNAPGGTSTLQIGVGSSPQLSLNLPGITMIGTPSFNTVGLTPAQVASSVGAGNYSLWCSGRL